MLEFFSKISTEHPWKTIIFFIILTAVIGSQIPKMEIEPDVKEQIPKDMPARANMDKIDEIFGGTDIVMISLISDDILEPNTLQKIKNISDSLEQVPGIDKVLSLFTVKDIKSEIMDNPAGGNPDTVLLVEDMVKRISKNPRRVEQLRESIRNNSIVYGKIVSEDFTASAVIGFASENSSDGIILEECRKIIDDNKGKEELYLGGLPPLRAEVAKNMKSDMRRFMPLGFLIMLIFLFICFKQIRGVLLPFIMVIMSMIVVLGLIPIFGWKMYMTTILLPVILIAVANDYGIHVIAHYQEYNKEGSQLTKKEISSKIIKNLGKPVLATGITTIAGLLCLLAHIIIPAQQMGILAALGIAYALIGSITFIPAVLSLLPKAKPVKTGTSEYENLGTIDKILFKTAHLVSKFPKSVLSISIIISLLLALGIPLIVVDTNPIHYFKDDAKVVKADDIINEYFGGSTIVSVIAEGDIRSNSAMTKIDEMEKKVSKLDNVGSVSSIAETVRKMNKVWHDDKEEYDKIPQEMNASAQFLTLYEMSTSDPDDLEKLVDFNYKHANISARIESKSTNDIKKVVEEIKKISSEIDDSGTFFKTIGGYAVVLADLVNYMLKGQIVSLLLSMFLVGIIVGLLFRSIAAGIISAFPLGLSLLILYGVMGILGIELSLVTVLLSSIMIGIGIDYTIHFLWRYREERKNGLNTKEAVKETLMTSGRGIVFNALSVIIGFIVLLLSNFLPVQFFGFLVVVSISACLIGALVILPAFCILFRPKFLEPKN